MALSSRRSWWAVAVSCAVACGYGPAPPPERPALRARGAEYTMFMPLSSAKHVSGYGLRTFAADADLTLESVVPARMPPGVELLATRLVYLKSPVGHGVQPYLGNLCTKRWPPAGFGQSREVAGTEVYAGEIIGIIAYIRPPGVGVFHVDGFDVTYRDAKGVRRHLREEAGSKVELEVLRPGQTSEHTVCRPLDEETSWLK